MRKQSFKNPNLNVGSLDRVAGIGDRTVQKLVENGYTMNTPIRTIDWRKMSDISGIGAERLAKIYMSVGIKIPVSTIQKYQGNKMQKSQTKMRITPSERGFSFSELSDDAKDVAMEEHKRGEYYEADYSDSDFMSEGFAEDLKNKGLPYEDIRFSLTYSQGDGVAFYGVMDFEEFFKKNPEFTKGFPEIKKVMKMYNALEDTNFKYELKDIFDGEIESNSNHYSHANTMYLNLEMPDIDSMVYDIVDEMGFEEAEEAGIDENAIEDEYRDLEGAIEDFVKDVAKDFENQGYEAIDYTQSEKAAEEYFNDFGYRFSKEGETIHEGW